MNQFSNLFKKENTSEIILSILFVLYLIMGFKTPEPIANVVDTLVGKIIIFLVVIYLFIYCNPILAVLFLFVAFDLIRRSSLATGSDALLRFQPSEEKRTTQFTAYNQFPYTLEQEVVAKMAPIMKTGTSLTKASYKPVLDNIYDATPVSSTN